MARELTFIEKGKGRIFVFNHQDVERVNDIIRNTDEFEHEYLPEGYIAEFTGNADDLIYTGKFGMNIPLLVQACGRHGIPILCRTEAPRECRCEC